MLGPLLVPDSIQVNAAGPKPQNLKGGKATTKGGNTVPKAKGVHWSVRSVFGQFSDRTEITEF